MRVWRVLYWTVFSWGVASFWSVGGAPTHKAERPPTLKFREFKVTFYCSCAVCTGPSSPDRGGHGLTARGNTPVPWRTAAVGDKRLRGKWIKLEDLGGWVYASDTGNALVQDQIDIYVGGSHMHGAARRLGVQAWGGYYR